MKMRSLIGLCVFALCWSQAGAAYPQTREYLLGDIDGIHYDGPGSVDDVYVDPGFWTWSLPHTYANGVEGFDDLSSDHALLFTFLFDVSPGEEVVAAALSVAMRATPGAVHNDRIDLEPTRGLRGDTFFRYDFSDLGWLPIPSTGVTVKTIDLANAFGCYDHPGVPNNLLPWLQDGKFNVMVHDDVGIDYATLTIEVVPGMPPVAVANGPYTLWVGDPLILNASASMDPDGEIVSYMWDLDDDGLFETDAVGQPFLVVDYEDVHNLGLAVGGMYDIHLKVTDNTGLIDTDSSSLRIVPEPATLSLLALGGLAMLRRRRR